MSATRRRAVWPAGLPRSSRRVFVLLAVLLAAVLVVLVVLLLWVLSRQPSGPGPYPDMAGLQAIFVIDGPGTGRHPRFSRPMGVAVGRNNRIYVADTGNDRVCVFSSAGHFLFEFGGTGVAKPLAGGVKTWRPGRFDYPVGIAADEDGLVYVADFRNDQIQVFDSDGHFVRAFPDPNQPVGRGSSGQGGAGIAVTDVSVRAGVVFATDSYQVFEFTPEGELIRQFGKPGRGAGDLDHPNGVAADVGSTVWVSDSNHERLVAFDWDGTVLRQSGSIPKDLNDVKTGSFDLPRGLTVMPDGTLLVADSFASELIQVAPNGRILRRLGQHGVLPGQLDLPNDVEMLARDVVVADKENDRVQVVRLAGSDVSLKDEASATAVTAGMAWVSR